jgi:hypothetical protein
MKLEDAREYYARHSTKASDVGRQLALAGLAVVWIFKTDKDGVLAVPHELVLPALLMMVGLAADLLQYLSGATVWGIYNRHKERTGTSPDVEFTAPRQLNWPIILFFWMKHAAIVAGYVVLLKFLSSRLGS